MIANELKPTACNRLNRGLVPMVHRPSQLHLGILHIVAKRYVVHPRLQRRVEEFEPASCVITDIENQAFTQEKMFESEAGRDTYIRDTSNSVDRLLAATTAQGQWPNTGTDRWTWPRSKHARLATWSSNRCVKLLALIVLAACMFSTYHERSEGTCSRSDPRAPLVGQGPRQEDLFNWKVDSVQ